MTANQKARVQILANKFLAKHTDINPYLWGGDVWRDWYSTHPRSEPVPEHLYPTEEHLRAFDILEAKYIAANLSKDSEYSTLLAFYESVIGKPEEKEVYKIVARTRPCRCQEAQCSLFCNYYGMENCYGSEDL